MESLHIAGAVITLIGSIFLFLGSVGLIRMPDFYNRIQAGTKASTLGTILTLIGLGLIHPYWGGKLIILIVFVVITNPVSSHVLGRAAHYTGLKLSSKTVTDMLAEDESKENESSKNQSL